MLIASVDTWLLCGGDSFTYFEREGPPDDDHPERLKVYLKSKRSASDEWQTTSETTHTHTHTHPSLPVCLSICLLLQAA